MNKITKNFKFLTVMGLALIIIGAIGIFTTRASNNNRDLITLQDSINVANVTSVNIRTRNQNVVVLPTSALDATITATGLLTDSTLNVAVNNGNLSIEVNEPRQGTVNFNFFSVPRTSSEPLQFISVVHPLLEISLPQNIYNNLTITTSNGRIEISDLVIDNLNLNTTNGRVNVRNIIGSLDVTSSNGRIEAADIDGDLFIRTTNGQMNFSNISGDIDAVTSNGSVDFRNDTIRQNVDIRSSNGRIELNLGEAPDNATFDVRTTNGSISLFGNNNQTQTFGDGRYDIVIRTSNGRITVE